MDIQRQYEEEKVKHIRKRTQQEQLISTLAEYFNSAPEELKSQFELPDHEFSLEGWCPELYKKYEDIDNKIYSEQLYKLNCFISKWNELVKKNNEEAAKWFAEYQQLTSKNV